MSVNKAVTKSVHIPAALRKLERDGFAALLATKVEDPTSKRQRWNRPLVSRRIAKDLRKKAIREGTYGTYDATNGVGWDKAWDEGLFKKKYNVGNINWMEVRGFKETKRERTRESRALKIEGLLETADDKIVAYRQSVRDKKPEGGIQNAIKKLIRLSTK